MIDLNNPNPKTHLKRAEVYVMSAKSKEDAIEQAKRNFYNCGYDLTTKTGYIKSISLKNGGWQVLIYDCYLMKQFSFTDYFRYFFRKAKTAICRYFGGKGFVVIIVSDERTTMVF